MTAIGAALALAACSTVVPRAPVAQPRPVAPPPQQTQNVPLPAIPTDVARHRVALLVPLTGPNAGVGQSLANATQLAILDANNNQMRVTTYDTGAGAAAAANRAVSEGAQLILGPLLAEDVRIVAPIARRAGVPVISFSNDQMVAGQGVFLLGYAPAQSVARVVEYARSQGVTNFAGLVPNGTYGERASTAFLRAVEAGHGQVLSLQTYERTPGAMTAAIQRMAANAPYGAVLIADSGSSAAAAVPLIRRSGSGGAHILGTELWNSDAGIGARATLNGAWFASVPDERYRQLAAHYRQRFSTAPYRLASLGYDSVLLLIRIAGDWPVDRPFPEARLRDSGGFSGIDGAFRFGRDNIAERMLEVQEVRGGTVVTVSPAPGGFGR